MTLPNVGDTLARVGAEIGRWHDERSRRMLEVWRDHWWGEVVGDLDTTMRRCRRVDMFERVLLCYDGSAAGRRALKRGAELAILVNAQVHVLSIISYAQADATMVAHSVGQICLVDDELEHRKSLEESIALLKARGVVAHGYLARGNTIDQIVAHAKRLSIDLIVVGHYPKSSGGRWWSGPQRTSLAERVNCCVFIAVNEANPPTPA